MASAPSASALSAVLRCRGNIWTRNPSTKRPVPSAHGLGLAGGAVRDSPAERNRWDAFLRGERVVVGGRLTVIVYTSPRERGQMLTKGCFRDTNKSCHPKPSHSPEDTHLAAPRAQNAPVRQAAHELTANLPGTDKCSKIQPVIKYQTHACHVREIEFPEEYREWTAGVLKVSMKRPCLTEEAGQAPGFISTGWSALKSTCVSLTALVSELMMLWRRSSSSSSSDDAPQHLQWPEDEGVLRKANAQILRPTALPPCKDNPSRVQKIPEDRPD